MIRIAKTQKELSQILNVSMIAIKNAIIKIKKIYKVAKYVQSTGLHGINQYGYNVGLIKNNL